MSPAPEPSATVRVDAWTWAVRLFPSRSQASAACTAGAVLIEGAPAKPAQKVRVGDEIEIRQRDRVRRVRIGRLIKKRVGAPIAVECYEMLEDRSTRVTEPGVAAWAERPRGTGRPTKRDRRQIDRWRQQGT